MNAPYDPPEGAGTRRPKLAAVDAVAVEGIDERLLDATEPTRVEADQTLSDADQTRADSDQTSADSDQLACDQDQAASDHELDAGLDPRVHEATRTVREATTRQRELTAEARLARAAGRDAVARARDAAADARDAAADARDSALRALDTEDDLDRLPQTAADLGLRAAEQRKRAASHRLMAARHREQAALDRLAAAGDRDHGKVERTRARADRSSLAHELALAATDPLTGARMRAAGLTDLDHEIDRCRRTDQTLAVAYLDVVGLKACNDAHGHEAGDALLQRVVAAIRQHLRSYDLVIRVGGDEFLCAMSGVAPAEVHQRFDRLTSALARSQEPTQVTAGFAQLEPGDTARELIARADGDMMGHRRTAGGQPGRAPG